MKVLNFLIFFFCKNANLNSLFYFLTNLSRSLTSLEEKISTITNENEKTRKNVADLATLIQQQNNFINHYIESIEKIRFHNNFQSF